MIAPFRRQSVCVCLLVMFCGLPAFGAEHVGIVTLDGKRYDDPFALSKTGVDILAPGRTLATLPASQILHADCGVPIHPAQSVIELTSGEALAIKEVARLDDTGLHCVPLVTSANLAIPVEQVARVFCTDDDAHLADRIPAGQSGVLLRGGDFFQGDIQQLDAGHVRVSSILFGTQNFDCRKQVIAVAFHDPARPDARWIARMLDGSVLRLNKLNCDVNEWLADDALLGSIRCNVSSFSIIDAGGDLVRSLADRKPDNADPATYVLNGTIPGVPMTLVGYTARQGIGQRAVSSLSWNLDGTEQSFVARVGIPATILPVSKVRFIVLTDGREAFRSELLSSVDDPVAIAVSLVGVKVLTLRVMDDSTAAATGLWADPMCVRP